VTVGSLSSVTHALLKAGGPSEAGSFRDIQLRRGGRVVASLDFQRLLLDGDRSVDPLVEADDVIHVGPVGPQAAIIGSVNQSAIFELKPGEGLAELLRMAGGFTAVADRSRVAIERLDDRANVRVVQVDLRQTPTLPVTAGDVVRVFSAVSAALPVERQNKRVRIEGEVQRPGDYVLPPNSSIADALQAAGGLTSAAYVFGAEFSRESVRQTQQSNYERALRDMETDFARSSASQRTSTAEEITAQSASSAATARLIERLRAVRPTGRVVLQIPPDATTLPELALEDGDRLYIPPRPTTVGVFGSVFTAGSYLHTSNRTLDDYLRLAGGPTRGADAKSVFVIRANGTVVSGLQQETGWFGRSDFGALSAEPGDTVFVPEEMNKTTFVQDAKDWTQIIYQLGIGVAALLAIGN
jgi:protein involved in polysaccharide export with SLBB domain